MFKKLKDKIAEEVKSSPSRIQQFAQAAQATVSSASSSVSDTVSGSGENFFSIAEEDTPQNTPQHHNAKSNDSVQLITSLSSLNSIPLNNGSGMANTQLDLFSKEQLHQAYKSALERYQKYRNRYTEVAKRYRDLERDNTKARSVLVETQDKALRRISESRVAHAEMSKQSNELNEANKKLQNEIQQKDAEIEGIKSEIKDLKEQLGGANKEMESNLVALGDKLAEKEHLLTTQRMECESLTDSMEKLQQKLSQCLDENSRLFNAKELMEHEYRSLQDRCEAKDKEKLCVLDTNQCLESDLTKLRSEAENVQALEREKNNLSVACDGMRNDLENLQKENSELKDVRDKLQAKCEPLSTELRELGNLKTDIESQLKELQQSSSNSSKNR